MEPINRCNLFNIKVYGVGECYFYQLEYCVFNKNVTAMKSFALLWMNQSIVTNFTVNIFKAKKNANNSVNKFYLSDRCNYLFLK